MRKVADHLADLAEGAGDRTEESLHRRASEMHRFFDDVEELLRKVSNVDDADIARLRSKVEGSIERVKGATRYSLEQALEGSRRAARATDEYVHDNPWTAIGVTAAAGLVAGALISSRR